MTQEEKQLLLKDICGRLPYGVKILYNGWDSDSDSDFNTVETLEGIDDKFIYTIWDKTGGEGKHCISVSNWKPYLRPMSSMTEEEVKEFYQIENIFPQVGYIKPNGSWHFTVNGVDWFNKRHFDYRGLIPMGLALEAPKDMYGK